MKVTLADIKVTHRVVELPDECPKCMRNFRELGGLVYWEFQDQSRPGKVDDEGMVVCDVERETTAPQTGESWIECVALHCGQCGASVVSADHEERVVDPPDSYIDTRATSR